MKRLRSFFSYLKETLPVSGSPPFVFDSGRRFAEPPPECSQYVRAPVETASSFWP